MPGSYFSMINSTGDYNKDSLVNSGKGRNIGIDITFEKFLTRQYYYLGTVSLFTSEYKGGDGIERDTRFNSGYVINLLGGKEWTDGMVVNRYRMACKAAGTKRSEV